MAEQHLEFIKCVFFVLRKPVKAGKLFPGPQISLRATTSSPSMNCSKFAWLSLLSAPCHWEVDVILFSNSSY